MNIFLGKRYFLQKISKIIIEHVQTSLIERKLLFPLDQILIEEKGVKSFVVCKLIIASKYAPRLKFSLHIKITMCNLYYYTTMFS